MACDSGCLAFFIGVESHDHGSLVSMAVTSQEVWGGSHERKPEAASNAVRAGGLEARPLCTGLSIPVPKDCCPKAPC